MKEVQRNRSFRPFKFFMIVIPDGSFVKHIFLTATSAVLEVSNMSVFSISLGFADDLFL